MSGASGPEWSHIVAADAVARTPVLHLAADQVTRGALARRLGLEALDRFEVDATLTATADGVRMDGRIDADVVQACAATGLPVPARVEEAFALRFVAAFDIGGEAADDEGIELDADDCDVLPMDDARIDVAEAAVQTLILALPPFPRHPDADAILRERGVKQEGETGAFAALAALKNLPK